MTTLLSAPKRARSRWVKLRAVLAAGVVLGIGATVTLAAWNDSEFAVGSFASGSFGIEGSADSVTFTEHSSPDTAAALTFGVNAESMSPGDTVYAPFALRLLPTSEYAATVSITEDESASIAGLSADYVVTMSPQCSASAYAQGMGQNIPSVMLPSHDTVVYFCIRVQADNTLAPGATGSISWAFAATSTTAL